MLVFVYGTLKKECRNHEYLQYSEYIGTAVTKETYFEMKEYFYTSGEGEAEKKVYFPSACTSGTGKIAGEIYNVSSEALTALDNLEEEGKLFFRQMVEFECGRSAWMYIEQDIYLQEACPAAHVKLDGNIYSYACG